MKRLLIVGMLLAIVIIQSGCKSEGGTDPKKRQQRINIDVQ
jgi:hypothetical protein